MSDFKMTKRAFPNLQIWAKPYKDDQLVVSAEELEDYLQSAQVVYGHVKQGKPNYWGPKENGRFDDTHTALIVGITPLKKKTKAEAALEFVEKFKSGMLSQVGYLEAEQEAEQILEMKDEA